MEGTCDNLTTSSPLTAMSNIRSAITSEEINYLIYRYLVESGALHIADVADLHIEQERTSLEWRSFQLLLSCAKTTSA